MSSIYFSVVLPAYNTPLDILRRAIDSVLNQTYPYFELIIVDDGSTPSLETIVSEYKDERIVFIRHTQNRGAGAAHNTGIKEASKKVKYCVGFDINAIPLKNEKVEILNSDYITFFQKNTTLFDVIIAFQFLEHIYNVNEFFKLVKDSLKTNGKLILAVPDNKSIIVKNEGSTNYPPHHMGWWTKRSLKKTCEYFGFKILYLKTEPLFKNYVYLKHNINEAKIINKLGKFGKIIYNNKIIFKVLDFIYHRFYKLFKSHSFIIIAEKI